LRTVSEKSIEQTAGISSVVLCLLFGDESATDFPVEDIVQYPLPSYVVAPASVAFSPDHKLVSYLYSPDNTLNRKVFLRLILSLVNATCSSILLAAVVVSMKGTFPLLRNCGEREIAGEGFWCDELRVGQGSSWFTLDGSSDAAG
jgi:hypothetical protein